VTTAELPAIPTAKPRAQNGTPGALPFGLKSAFALAVLSGFLYFLAFPGVDCWPLAFVALAPLIVAIEGQTPKHALLCGWAAGLTMTLCGFYWLLDMLQTFSGFPAPICAIFLALLCAYQGGRICLLCWLTARGSAKGYGRALPFVLAFVASELVYPLIFPWTYAGTVHQVPSLLQLAELGGPITVGLPLVAANLVIAELALALLGRRPFRRWALAGLAAPLLATLYGLVRLPQIDARVARAKHASVALIQANMSLLGKRERVDEGLRRHLDLSAQARREGPLDLVVWSETSVMAAVGEEDVERVIPRLVGRRLGVPALFGAVIARPVDDVRGNVFFNSVLLTDASGNVRGRYDKQYRLPFGEFLPLGDTFPVFYEWSPNSGRFAAGTSLAPLTLGQHQLATFVCYEDVIPGFVRDIVAAGDPDLLVNLTNDAWFGDTTEPWIHLALAKFRAIEHRRFFVRSTNSGVSAVVDPAGRVTAHTTTFEQTALRADIAWLHDRTLYERLGNAPWWLASIASLALAFLPRPKRRGATSSDLPHTRPEIMKSEVSADSEKAREFRGLSHRFLSRRSPATRGESE
jgi:apolipoprotein N-acyltransferase